MPYAPPSPCLEPGCGALCHTPRCPEHTRQHDRRDRQRRGSSSRRGYTRRHYKLREIVLARDPICRACGEEPSEVSDHIIALRRGGAPFDLSNLQGLCRKCHNRKTARERGRGG
jgi:5-methylcytosine-specific restriction protein A